MSRELNAQNTVSADRLREVLNYNIINGIFTWKVDIGGKYKKGMVAGHLSKKGYIELRVDKILYLAHRLAWLYVYGYMPHMVDHRDEHKDNNAIWNLRRTDKSKNGSNRGKQENNTTGYKGVGRLTKYGKYPAKIQVLGKSITIGYFSSKAEASDAYLRSAEKYFGEFAKR